MLIRSDLIRKRDPFYDESTLQADKDVCYEILREYDFGFVHQVLTFTRRHNESNTAKVQSVNTQRRMLTLKKYGPVFLSEKEFNKLYEQAINLYHAHLTRAFFELKEKSFFRFHNEKLRQMGEPLRWGKLAKAAIIQMSHVRDTIGAIRYGIAKRRGEKSCFCSNFTDRIS